MCEALYIKPGQEAFYLKKSGAAAKDEFISSVVVVLLLLSTKAVLHTKTNVQRFQGNLLISLNR
jgi:hypothetical protein